MSSSGWAGLLMFSRLALYFRKYLEKFFEILSFLTIDLCEQMFYYVATRGSCNMQNMNEKKEIIIEMVELMQDEKRVDFILQFLTNEIQEEIKKGLIKSP